MVFSLQLLMTAFKSSFVVIYYAKIPYSCKNIDKEDTTTQEFYLSSLIIKYKSSPEVFLPENGKKETSNTNQFYSYFDM